MFPLFNKTYFQFLDKCNLDKPLKTSICLSIAGEKESSNYTNKLTMAVLEIDLID